MSPEEKAGKRINALLEEASELWNNIKTNWKWVITSLLLGQCFAFWVIPLILSVIVIKSFFALDISPTFILISAISFLLLFFAYKPSSDFWIRYKENFKLQEVPFTYMDGLFVFSASTAISISIFYERILGDLSPSIPVKMLLTTWSILFVIWCLTIKYKRRSPKGKPKVQSSSPDYFSDEPITDKSEDLLDRGKFVDDLYNQITKYPLIDSFVFAIYGNWGEGKTSVLNLLKNKLNQNDDVIVFDFDPWYFSSQDKLIENFYQGFYNSLDQRFFLPNTKRVFSRYQKILSSGLKYYGFDFDLQWGDDSLEKLREKIENSITVTGKKFIVLIDDIDRLQNKEEIHQIFNLVKLSARFKNTIFILSFDPMIINSFFKNEVSGDLGFLDKIVQAPIHLPAVDQAAIDRYLYYSYPDEGHYSGIDRLFQKLQIDQGRIRTFENAYLYESKIKGPFTTLRHAKRYLNALYQTLPSIKNEVNLQDFLIFEVIRVFYPGVYSDIWSHPWYYIPAHWNDRLNMTYPFKYYSDENEKYQKIKEHISALLQNQPEREVLQELLETIFFVEVKNAFAKNALVGKTGHDNMSSSYLSEKRITHPDVFPKYFMLKVPISELPDEIVESMISSWNSSDPTDLESKILEDLKRFQEKKQLVKLLEKLIIFLPRIPQNTAIAMINSLYKNFKYFSKEGRQYFLQSEFYYAESLMFRLINEKIDGDNIEELLIRIIKETPSFYLATSIVLDCRREMGGSLFKIYDDINIENLHNTLSDRLSQHFIEEGRDIFADEPDSCNFILYQWGIYNQEDKDKVNEYVLSLIHRNPRHLGNIIKSFVSTWSPSGRKEFRFNDLSKLYDENRLYSKVKKNYNTSFSNQEEKSAIDLFIKTYDERNSSALMEAKQRASQQQFSTASTRGFEHFNKGNFADAFSEFNKALQFTDWKDDNNQIGLVKLKKWQCLLELSWNNDGQALRKDHFDEACKLAANEVQIKTLEESAYKNGAIDQAPIELYYCLFYFLQWSFSDEQQKPTIKENFMMHYNLATGDNASGRSNEITERCDIWKRLIEGNQRS